MGNGTYSHRSLVDIYTGTDAPQLGNVAAWNIFLEWQVFDHIPAEGSISYGELAELVGAEESLIGM